MSASPTEPADERGPGVGPTAPAYFGRIVPEYDSLIRRAVPRYDEMLDRLVAYLPEARRILELGAGTGNLSLALAHRFPDAELTLVDDAAAMLAVVRDRLGFRQPGRTHLIRARFEELPDDLAAPFDLITSSISLHHVADKGPLYVRLRALLRPGGHLVFADQLRGGTEPIHAINWQRWLDFCDLGCRPAEIRDLLDHAAQHDHYTSLVEHLHLLDAAGFDDLDCVWRNWIWGIVSARARD